MNEKKNFATFLWRITAIHTIAYFIAGIFALIFMNYKSLFTTEALSIMRPIFKWIPQKKCNQTHFILKFFLCRF